LGEFSHYDGNFFGNFWKHLFWSINWKKFAKILENFAKLSKPQIFYKKTLVTSSVLFWVNFHTVLKQKISGAICTKLFLEVFGKSCGFLHVDPCPKWHGFMSTMLGDLCDPVAIFINCWLCPQLGWNLEKLLKLSIIHFQCTHDQSTVITMLI